jgi:hypothetical protein
MSERIRMGRRRSRLRRGRMVYAASPVPAWVPEPVDPPSRWRRVHREPADRSAVAFQPVGEAVLRTVSDGSAVLSIVRR